jgi:hypothetical protein
MKVASRERHCHVDRSACEARGVGIVIGAVFNSGLLAPGPVPGVQYDYRPLPPRWHVRAGVTRHSAWQPISRPVTAWHAGRRRLAQSPPSAKRAKLLADLAGVHVGSETLRTQAERVARFCHRSSELGVCHGLAQ